MKFCSPTWTLVLACQLPEQASYRQLISFWGWTGLWWLTLEQDMCLSECAACHLLPIEAHENPSANLSSSYMLGQLLVDASSKCQPHIMCGKFRCSIPHTNRRNCTKHFISGLVSRVYRVCLIPAGVSLHLLLALWVTCKPAVSNYNSVVSSQAYRGCT